MPTKQSFKRLLRDCFVAKNAARNDNVQFIAAILLRDVLAKMRQAHR